MVGLLLDVGTGKTPKEKIPMIIASKDRRQAGQTAPGHPLFLAKIVYNAQAFEHPTTPKVNFSS